MLKRSSKRDRGKKRNLKIEFNKLSTIKGAGGQKSLLYASRPQATCWGFHERDRKHPGNTQTSAPVITDRTPINVRVTFVRLLTNGDPAVTEYTVRTGILCSTISSGTN